MDNTAKNSSSGFGFGGLLTIVFIVLKLTKVISWSWFWVLSPIILPSIVVLGILLVGVILEVIVAVGRK